MLCAARGLARQSQTSGRKRPAASTYDLGYLAENVYGGEGFDWYYTDNSARTAQNRTPITDGLGKPWTFRVKDIKSWWSSAHYERVSEKSNFQARHEALG